MKTPNGAVALPCSSAAATPGAAAGNIASKAASTRGCSSFGTLAPLTKGRPVLALARGLSAGVAADVSLGLDHGGLVGQGTHAERLRLGGVYAGLYRQQFAAGDLSPQAEGMAAV